MGKLSEDGLPWWVNAIYKVGVPTAIACYLVWFLATRIQANMDSYQVSMNNMQKLMETHITEQQEGTRVNKRILEALQMICVNTTDSKNERADCIK
jgi:hypothetical protein